MSKIKITVTPVPSVVERMNKLANLTFQVPSDDMFEEVVDVSAGLSNTTRILYSKVAKKATFLDDFLSRRLQLKSLEERRIELEDKKLGVTRVYSSFNASGKLYLKKIRTVAESKKQSKIIKYPLVRIIICCIL